MVMSMKQRMRQALSRRLPVTELNIIAALLDPSQRNLTVVQDFLVAQETTAFHLLSQAINIRYRGGLQASNNASGMNEAASSSESAQSPVPWKKAKQELLSKHVHSTGTGDTEVSCIDVCRLHLMMF